MPANIKFMTDAQMRELDAINTEITRIREESKNLWFVTPSKTSAANTTLLSLRDSTNSMLNSLSEQLNTTGFYFPGNKNFQIDSKQLLNDLSQFSLFSLTNNKPLYTAAKNISYEIEVKYWRELYTRLTVNAHQYTPTEDYRKRLENRARSLMRVAGITIMALLAAGAAAAVALAMIAFPPAGVGLGLASASAFVANYTFAIGCFSIMAGCGGLSVGVASFPLMDKFLWPKIKAFIDKKVAPKALKEQNPDDKREFENAITTIAQQNNEKREKIEAQRAAKEANKVAQQKAEEQQRKDAKKQKLEAFYHVDEHGNGHIVDALRKRIACKNKLIDDVENISTVADQKKLEDQVTRKLKELEGLEPKYREALKTLQQNHVDKGCKTILDENTPLEIFETLTDSIYDKKMLNRVSHYLKHKHILARFNAVKEIIELKIQLLHEKQEKYSNEKTYISAKIAKYTKDADHKRSIADVLKGYSSPHYPEYDNRSPFGDDRFDTRERVNGSTFKHDNDTFRLFTPYSKKITRELHLEFTKMKKLKP